MQPELTSGTYRMRAMESQLRGKEPMATVQLKSTMESQSRPVQVADAELLQAVKRAEEALRQKSAFLADMSHELRTPLSSIIGFAELLRSLAFGPLSGQQAHCIENILTSAHHLLMLTNDLLDLSKIEAGKLVIQRESIILREAFDATVYTVRPQTDRKSQTLKVTVEDGLPWIKADPLRFRQILYNLLSNAIKFTPVGGTITITARPKSAVQGPRSTDDSAAPPTPSTPLTGNFAEIAIADTGIGLKATDLSRLFQRFTQLEAPTVKQQQGTGLGLALTKSLVELHGGSIQVHSEGEGRGSTFTVRLPLE